MKTLSQTPGAIKQRKNRAKSLEKYRERDRAYCRRDPEKYRERGRRYRANYPEKFRASVRKYEGENPDKVRSWQVRALLKKYGMTVAQYDALLISQSGRCACCHNVLILGGLKNLSAVVDHNHVTRKVRAILCSGCNMGIGHLGDDPARCEKAAAYLRKHQPDFKSHSAEANLVTDPIRAGDHSSGCPSPDFSI